MICLHITHNLPPEGASFDAQRVWKIGKWQIQWFCGTPKSPNQPLIAAAPHLLRVLELALPYPPDDAVAPDLRARVAAAIAKANGEPA